MPICFRYGNPARKDSVDYVLHLGDYIYEYAGTGDYGYGESLGRVPAPYGLEIYSLYDYRARLSAYRTDADLLLSHQTYPWIPVSITIIERNVEQAFGNECKARPMLTYTLRLHRFGTITKYLTIPIVMERQN